MIDLSQVLTKAAIHLTVSILAASWVWRDARKLKEKGADLSPGLWTALVCLLLIVSLPIYFVLRQTTWRIQMRQREESDPSMERSIHAQTLQRAADSAPALEQDPSKDEYGLTGGLVITAVLLAAVLGGAGSVLFVDRNPQFQIDHVFLTSWMTLFPTLAALFIIIRGFRAHDLGRSAKPAAKFLLMGLLIGAAGFLLSWADLWVLVPLIFVIFTFLGRWRKKGNLTPNQAPAPDSWRRR